MLIKIDGIRVPHSTATFNIRNRFNITKRNIDFLMSFMQDKVSMNADFKLLLLHIDTIF